METILIGSIRRRQALYASMWGQGTSSPWLRLGLAPLWLAAKGYGALARGRLASYAWGVCRTRRLPCTVVSIGNLTLGGTGKTPLTMWVARWYQQRGWRVAVLSRGYGARPPTRLRVVSTGTGPVVAWPEAGDEPYLLACALPGVPVVIGKNRYETGRYAYEQFGAQVLLLDDGFQYYALQRNLDIVLVDASNPFGQGALLPRGILREPLQALSRADAIVLTRVEMAGETLPTLRGQIRRWAAQQPMYCMTTVVESLHQWQTGELLSLSTLRQGRVVAFVGIGNPQAFITTLTQLGAEVAACLVFHDHHPYSAADWHTIIETARQQKATCLLTTEKDAVRLASVWQTPIPVYTLRIGVTFATDEPLLAQQLQVPGDVTDAR